MDNTFFNLKLDLEPNIIDMIYDILRMSTIQIITQTMFYMNNSSLSLFSETFIKTFVFINFGIIVYYLLIRKLFSFVSDDYLRVTDNTYTSTPPMTNTTSNSLPKAPPMSPPSPQPTPPTPPPPQPPSTPPPTPPMNNSPKSNSNTLLNNNNNIANNSTNTVL
uniref:Uncharacterized protein n=1 Tax=viral metagenome TaxID=1070528 RepID=A0A6C0C713_9ZZZZ